MFYLNTDKYDLMQVYNCIAKYFPIGVHRENNPAYDDYPGIKEMTKIIVEAIHDENNFKNGWVKIEAEIQAAIPREIIGATFGQDIRRFIFLLAYLGHFILLSAKTETKSV